MGWLEYNHQKIVYFDQSEVFCVIPFPPCMATASTPFNNRYSCIASTSCFFSAKSDRLPQNTGAAEY